MQGTIWTLLPPLITIILAILTKEVYISLFSGIFVSALIFCNFNMIPNETSPDAINVMFDIMTTSVNMQITIFLILLGTIVVLVNKSGGTNAFENFINNKIKTKRNALISTQIFAISLFIDDYFSCLTSGNVMKSITDKNKVSRSKLTYIIHSTVVPICMLMPISSWAAAISSSLSESGAPNGLQFFIKVIPYNLYCILALIMVFTTSAFNINYSTMLKHEKNAENGNLFSDSGDKIKNTQKNTNKKTNGKIIDLIIPISALIVFCIIGIILDKKFKTDNGLLFGALMSLITAFILYIPRKIITFKEFLNSFTEGFKEMASAIIILTLAWSFSKITTDKDYLFIGGFISNVIKNISGLTLFIPAILFIVSILLSVSTGTSWGTFTMLIPITFSMFPLNNQLLLVSVAAVLAGSACGDNVSPISDTTIMSCTGTNCTIENHMATQLPYAALVASISAVGFLVAGIVQNPYIPLIFSIALLLIVLTSIKIYHKKEV